MAARDPRYRPYRFALWLLYFGLIVGASAVVVTSIVRNLRGPPSPPPLGDVPTRAALRVCLDDLERLAREQDERLFRLGADAGQGDAVARWNAWSADWEVRMRDLAARCALDHADPGSPDARAIDEIARARDAVLDLHAGYGRLVNRFASDQAELARAAWRALEGARLAVRRPRD
ncbi:MAG TPA: hypothetical protein VLU43_14025 [Anaeromyxobacteraceae bacterium]|nr:hypothetical protein [Anaeromyxobacteraceae bacterium]